MIDFEIVGEITDIETIATGKGVRDREVEKAVRRQPMAKT